MPSKNYTLFFVLSVGFVLISITFITILGQTSSKDKGTTDIRAKATVQNSMQLQGVVGTVDGTTLTVTDVSFADNDSAKPMGTFTVIVPAETSVVRGQRVLLYVDSATFNIAEKKFTALSVAGR